MRGGPCAAGAAARVVRRPPPAPDPRPPVARRRPREASPLPWPGPRRPPPVGPSEVQQDVAVDVDDAGAAERELARAGAVAEVGVAVQQDARLVLEHQPP